MHMQRGFTLLELLIVIAVASVLTGIAVPGMRSIVLSGARSEASTSLYGALVEARSEAISRNAYVLLCARDPATTNASPKCQTGTADWTRGWVMLRDANQNGVVDSGDPAAVDVIAAGDATDSSFKVVGLPAAPTYLSFSSSGLPSPALTFTLCKTGDTSFQGRIIYADAGDHVSLAPYACT